jgi:hypothetical protein
MKKKKSHKRPKKQSTRSKNRTIVFPSKLRTIALLVVSVFVALVIVESVIRIIYGDKFGKRPVFYVRNEKLGWSPGRNLNHTFYGPDYNIHVRTDSEGRRLGVLGEVDYGKNLIVLCGDSYAFGWGVSTQETFASFLDKYIYDETGGDMRLVNLGVGGYGTAQEYYCLLDFLHAHSDANVEAVIWEHTVNDALDNVRNFGYIGGLWEVRDRFKTRSRLHSINLFAYLAEAFQSNHSSSEVSDSLLSKQPFVQDMLWGFERVGWSILWPEVIQFESGNVILGEVLEEGERQMKSEEYIQRKNLTKFQRILMLESMNNLHAKLKKRGINDIFHMFVYTAPDWYIDEVSGLIRQSIDATGTRATVLGRTPADGTFSGRVMNSHSGQHYTAKLNHFWAAAVLDTLRKYGITP